jgi:hypothetical protein
MTVGTRVGMETDPWRPHGPDSTTRERGSEARHLKDKHWCQQGQCPHLCGVLSEVVWQIGRNTVGGGFGFRLLVAFLPSWWTSSASDVT